MNELTPISDLLASAPPRENTDPLYGGLVPAGDVDEFMAIPSAARSKFGVIASYLPGIMAATDRMQACAEAGAALKLSAERVYNMVFLGYSKSHDWRDLLDKRIAGARFWKTQDLIGVPKATVQFYKSIVEKYKRGQGSMSGHKEFIAIYKTHRDAEGLYHDRIPGYTSWPKADPHTGIPKGWSYKNMERLADHHPYDLASERRSQFAASMYRPPVLTTRIGLKLLERIEFDDHEYNVKIHFPGQSKAMRPRGFNAVDVLTCCTFAKSFKPTLWDADLKKKEALTETDAMWFIVHILCDIGYRTDAAGTTIACENGTATIKPPFEKRIIACTNGHVKISRGAMLGEAAHAGQFAGDAKGNFKHKPLVEGSFGLIDNRFSRLPGETGLDRNYFPTDTGGREKYLAWLLKKIANLPIDQVADIQLPILTWSDYLNRALDIYKTINGARDHDIADWEQCGFVAMEVRWDEAMPWMPVRSLPPAVQHALAQSGDAVVTRAVKLSRQEAFDSLIKSPDIQRIPPIMFPELMGPEAARTLKVTKQSLFEFQDSDYGSQPFRYLAATRQKQFTPGDEFQCYVNPWNPRVLVACDDKGRVQGLCEWYDVPCKNDHESIKRLMGRQNHWEADRKADKAARHLGEAEDRAHMFAHNEAVIAKASAAKKNTRNPLVDVSKVADDDFTNLPAGNNFNPAEEDAIDDAFLSLPTHTQPNAYE